MSINLRKRGKIWYARGTLRIGRETLTVPQFSTGCDRRADAQAIAEAEAQRIRVAHEAGPAGRQLALTIDDIFAAYVQRPGGVALYDRQRIRNLSDRIGDRPLAEAASAWSAWVSMRGAEIAPATIARHRTLFCAALNHGCAALDAGAPPKIPSVRQRIIERATYLSDAERERLLASYNPSAARVALMLAYQGLRTQEALRLDWRDISLTRQTIRIAPGKTGKSRTVPMHPKVAAMLRQLIAAAGAHPDIGPVFLSERGTPYADSRQNSSGNPLKRSHSTACGRANIKNFRVHDWRHDWAARMVMSGADLYTLMRLGGWSSLKMIERYATITADHAHAAIAKLA